MASPNILAGIAGGGGVLEGIERAQQRNQRNELMQYEREDRQRKSQLLRAFPGAIAGDQNALSLVAQSDPQTFMGLQKHHSELAALKREEARKRQQQYAGASLYALDTVGKLPPEQQQQAYQQIVGQLQQMDPEMFEAFGGAPQQYDPSFARAAAPRLFAIAAGDKLPEIIAQRGKGAKFNNPVAGVNPKTGKPEFRQFSEDGANQVVPDFAPPPVDAKTRQRRLVDKPLPDGRIQKVWVDDQGNELGNFGAPAMSARGTTGVPTQDERQAAFLLKRIEKADADIARATGEVDEAGDPIPPEKRTSAQRSAEKPGLWAATVGLISDTGRNAANSEERQRVEAAQMDALDAALTLATGAAYTQIQLESLRRSYFPQIGDDDATVKDKKARYDNLIQSAKIRAGRAIQPQPGMAVVDDKMSDDDIIGEAERIISERRQ